MAHAVVSGLSQRRPACDPRHANEGFAFDQVAMCQDILRVLQYSLPYHFTSDTYSSTYHRQHTMLANGSANKHTYSNIT